MNSRFQHIINSSKPVLVDFYADWCVPCKDVAPVLKKVKKDLSRDVKIVKVNVDKNPFIASEFNVKNLPTLMVFKNGTPKFTVEGVCCADELKEVLRKQLDN